MFGTSAPARVLGLHGGNQETVSYYSVPATVARIAGIDALPDAGRPGGRYGVGVVWLLAWTARGGDWVRATAWAALGLLCATAWLAPWYLIWALPLVAVARDRILVALTLALCALSVVGRGSGVSGERIHERRN